MNRQTKGEYIQIKTPQSK